MDPVGEDNEDAEEVDVVNFLNPNNNMWGADDDNSSSSHRRLSQADLYPPLNTLWECPMINVATRPDPEVDGKYIDGWTCGFCPAPLHGSPENFFPR